MSASDDREITYFWVHLKPVFGVSGPATMVGHSTWGSNRLGNIIIDTDTLFVSLYGGDRIWFMCRKKKEEEGAS